MEPIYYEGIKKKLAKYVRKMCGDVKKSPNTSIDAITITPKIKTGLFKSEVVPENKIYDALDEGKNLEYHVNIRCVVQSPQFDFVVKTDNKEVQWEIEKNGIEQFVYKILKPFNKFTTAQKHGRKIKTLTNMIQFYDDVEKKEIPKSEEIHIIRNKKHPVLEALFPYAFGRNIPDNNIGNYFDRTHRANTK